MKFMKKSLLISSSVALALVFSLASYAQQSRSMMVARNARVPIPNESMPAGSPAAKPTVHHSVPLSPLPASIILPGVDMLPIMGTWVQQSNGRSLHNVQVDPSNPLNVHAVITGSLNLTASDTAALPGNGFTADTGRRCFYLFSSNGGKDWAAPVLLSNSRQGYADMILFQRGSVWVPAIVTHKYFPNANGNLLVSLQIEKGQPGAGDFAEAVSNRTDADGNSPTDIIWPILSINRTNDTVYVCGSVSTANGGGTATGLQFGKFALNSTKDGATFISWSGKPGDYSGVTTTTGPGITSGGDYHIQVSASGRIGVAWQCLSNPQGYQGDPADPTGSIYYSESTDGGTTWTADPDVVAAIDPNMDAQGNQYSPTNSFDFWFDGETPKFVVVQTIYNYSQAPAITYYPNSAMLYYKNLLTGDSVVIAHSDTTTTIENPIPNVMHLPVGSQIHVQGEMISYPAVALTSNSGRLAVAYQTYAEGDSALVTDDGTTFDTLAYGSIYYSETNNGGLTWGTPTPWMVNTGSGKKYDFRSPQTSYYNPIASGKATYHLLFAVDSAAGWVIQNGVTPGFDIISYGHAVATGVQAGVSGTPSSSSSTLTISPNPFFNSTTISLSSAASGSVSLVVRDALGREYYTSDTRKLSAGSIESFDLNANGLGLAPGVYYVTARDGASQVTCKVVYLK